MSAIPNLWALRDRRPWFVGLGLVGLGFFLVYPFVDLWLQQQGIAATYQFFDFGVYGGAVERWQSNLPLYRQNDAGGYHGSYLYPPFVLLLFVPFVELLPVSLEALLWGVTSVALLWIGLQFVIGALGCRLHPIERIGLLWVLLGFQPLLISLKLGQMAGFQGGLLCCGLAAMLWGTSGEHNVSQGTARVARMASGGLTALVGLVKLPYATAGAHLLADRDRFLGAVVTGSVLIGGSVLVFGLDTHLAYLDVLRWGAVHNPQTRAPSLWLPPYFRPLHWMPFAQLLRYSAAVAIAVGALLARPSADRETFALGTAAVALLAPVTYTYYLVATIPAIVLLIAIELDHEPGYPAIPVVSAVLIGGHSHGLWFVVSVLPSWIPQITALKPFFWAQPGLWGSLLLVGLAGKRVAEAVTLPGPVGDRFARR